MRRMQRVVLLAAALGWLPALGMAATVKIVDVDCTKGESINAALEEKADNLVVRIAGVCSEDVIVRRDDVTLRGSSPAASEIRHGGTPNEAGLAVVRVWTARGVRLENLTISGGVRHGLLADHSSVILADSVVKDNALHGVAAFIASDLVAERVTLSDNGGWGLVAVNSNVTMTTARIEGNSGGLRVRSGSELRCVSCELEDNWRGVTSSHASYAILYDSEISGQLGAEAYMSGFVYGENTPVTAATTALYSSEQGDLNWVGSDFSGDVVVEWSSLLYTDSVTQTASGPGGNRLSENSTAYLVDTNLDGTTNLDAFATGRAIARQPGSSSLGQVACANGSDLLCQGGVSRVSPTGCGLCP